MKDFNFTLQMKGEENKVIGNIVQNDTANRFIIRLRDGISPVVLDETDIITVTYKRSNDTVVIDAMGGESVAITDYEKGEITIIPDVAAVQNVGIVKATVEVYDGTGAKLSSTRFSFTVTPDLAGHADASGDSSFPALQNLITLLATKHDGWESAEAQRVTNENARVVNEDNRVIAEQERAQVWAQLEEMCRQLIKEMVSPSVEIKSSTPLEYILTVTDKDGSFDTPNLKPGWGSGTGDMVMADYDPDADGSVTKADWAINADKANNAINAENAKNAENASYAENAKNAESAKNAETAGSADTANKLKTPRKIGTTIFDGSVDISLAEMGAATARQGEKADKAMPKANFSFDASTGTLNITL